MCFLDIWSIPDLENSSTGCAVNAFASYVIWLLAVCPSTICATGTLGLLSIYQLERPSIHQCIPTINCIIHPFISCNNLLHFLCMPLFFCSRLLPSIHYPYNSSTNGTIHPNVQPFTPNYICSSIYQFRNLATDCTVPSTPTTPASYASNNLEVIRSPFSSSSLGWTKETLDGEREVSRPWIVFCR